METKNFCNIDMWIDLGMTKLFQLAEYICNKTSCPAPEQSLEPSDTEPIIRFPNVGKVVEGDLFSPRTT